MRATGAPRLPQRATSVLRAALVRPQKETETILDEVRRDGICFLVEVEGSEKQNPIQLKIIEDIPPITS